MRTVVPRAMVVAAALLAATAGSAHAEDAAEPLSVTVDPDLLFEEEPRWMLGLRAGVGFPSESRPAFPTVGATLGRTFPGHFLLEGIASAGLGSRPDLTVGLRSGLSLEGEWLTGAMVVSPALLWIPDTGEVGPIGIWGLEMSVHVTRRHAVLVEGHVDMLFDALGFSETRQRVHVGLGWTWRF
ncbi:MAG: hypothetical protein ACQEXJ_16280 [Myxococcota bacterium]